MLHFAAGNGKINVVNYLFGFNADPYFQNNVSVIIVIL